jgi:hypothetical protein
MISFPVLYLVRKICIDNHVSAYALDLCESGVVFYKSTGPVFLPWYEWHHQGQFAVLYLVRKICIDNHVSESCPGSEYNKKLGKLSLVVLMGPRIYRSLPFCLNQGAWVLIGSLCPGLV